ncbi:MAG: hypothetical protein HYR74_04195 [Candidatus Eisenbacteria bacterium]|nr:hypothetical protein [Candidatus Eisenbacteria bacterium]
MSSAPVATAMPTLRDPAFDPDAWREAWASVGSVALWRPRERGRAGFGSSRRGG